MKRKSKKGFTLIELIVVVAIIAILAAIAIPRFAEMQATSTLKADGATAAQIVTAARVYEAENNSTPAIADLSPNYIVAGLAPQGGGTYVLGGGGPANYTVSWTSTKAPYAGAQQYEENVAWTPVRH